MTRAPVTGSKNTEGTFTKTGTEYGTALYRANDAEELFRRMRKGDTFIVIGSFEQFPYTGKDGQPKSKTMFVARHLGHDASRTLYAVGRIPRALAEDWHHTQNLVGEDFSQRAAKLGADAAAILAECAAQVRAVPGSDHEAAAASSPFRDAAGI